MVVLKLQGTVIGESKRCAEADPQHYNTSRRTSVEANTILGKIASSERFERSVEHVDANRITNDHRGAGVEDRFKGFPSRVYVSVLRDTDLIDGRLPELYPDVKQALAIYTQFYEGERPYGTGLPK
jgi:hypothetical protein